MSANDFDNPTTSSDSSSQSAGGKRDRFTELGEKLFGWRDYTPIPLILLVLIFASPSARSATLGMLLIVAGELVRVYSVAFIGSVSRTRNISTTGARLITGGPFSVVRNPLYVGNFLITIGLAVYAGPWWLVVVAALAFAFQYAAIVRFEETLLSARFGQEYEDFKRQVPAWFPRRLPALSDLAAPVELMPALRSEKRTLLAIAAMLLILMALS